MEFDISNVYTAVNADELCKGDLVFVSDTLQELKTLVEFNDKADLKEIHFIRAEDKHNRFYVGDDDYGGKYILAYLVCPARNAEAYKVWSEGKAVERRICEGKEESLWLLQKPERNIIDDWCLHTFRVAMQEEPSISSYRQYKSVEELVSDFKERFDTHTPAYAMPLIWLQNKRGVTKKKKLITAFNEGDNFVYLDGEIYDLNYLFKDYTFLDGTPCGVEQ